MVKVAKEGKLASSEIPSATHLEPEPWLPTSGLVTPTLKLKRPKLRERYTHAIKQLYQGSPSSHYTPAALPPGCFMAPREPTANTQTLDAKAKVQDDDICVLQTFKQLWVTRGRMRRFPAIDYINIFYICIQLYVFITKTR